ncbi:MAG: site-specific integrase [Pirellulales bacterium]|nr:site-specific integrase [Pirellulales bacterium]
MTSKVVEKGKSVKPTKPRPDFPLFIHQSGGGRWCKKVRGRFCYFGKVADDPEGKAALEKWLDEKDDLLAGRTPRKKREGLTVADLVNHYLTTKERMRDNGEIAKRTYEDYYTVCERIIRVFGKNRIVDDLVASDFATLRSDFAETRGPHSLAGDITRVRCVFKYGYDEGLLDRPIRYGQSFARPSHKVLRKAKQAGVDKIFSAKEIKRLINAAGPQMKAMILLACNTGFGNGDLGRLPTGAVNLKTGWVDYPRPKTGIERRCPLWAETIKAIKKYLPKRPQPTDKSVEYLLFLTAKGNCWTKDHADNPIAKEFSKLQKEVGTFKKGRGFYALRHTFQTIGDGSRDPVAVKYLMGHAADASDMGSVYREHVEDERLQAVVNTVHAWLYPPKKKPR